MNPSMGARSAPSMAPNGPANPPTPRLRHLAGVLRRASREPVERQPEPVERGSNAHRRQSAPVGCCLLHLDVASRRGDLATCGGLLWLAPPSIQICLASGGQALTGPSGRQGWRPRAPRDGFTARPGRAWPPLANTETPSANASAFAFSQPAKPAATQPLTAAANAASRRTFRGSADAGSSDPRSVRRPHRRPRPALCAPCGTPPRWR